MKRNQRQYAGPLMDLQALTLIVDECKGCPMLKQGDRWYVNGHDVRGMGSHLCFAGLVSLYPQLETFLYAPPGQKPELPSKLHCEHTGCAVSFRAEQSAALTIPEKPAENIAGIPQEGPFLARVPPEVAHRLVAACTPREFKDGEVILAEGTVGEHLFIVGDGEVEVTITKPDSGHATLLARLGWGECFGEMSLLTGSKTSATCCAKGTTKVLMLTRAHLEEHLGASPALNRIFSHLLADRLRNINLTLESERDRGLKGKLSMISLGDLVQTFKGSRGTGTLVLERKDHDARIGFEGGEVKFALAGTLKAEAAFYEVFNWSEGDFSFKPGACEFHADAAVKLDTMGLLMESMRRLDETQRLLK